MEGRGRYLRKQGQSNGRWLRRSEARVGDTHAVARPEGAHSMSRATRTTKRAVSIAPRIRSAVMIPDAAARTCATRAPRLGPCLLLPAFPPSPHPRPHPHPHPHPRPHTCLSCPAVAKRLSHTSGHGGQEPGKLAKPAGARGALAGVARLVLRCSWRTDLPAHEVVLPGTPQAWHPPSLDLAPLTQCRSSARLDRPART